MDSVPSRVEDILLALINNTEYDGPIISRVEQILYSFLENSEYAAEPESRVEAILVALKAASLYDDAVISRIEKILYSKLNGTEYAAEPESRVEELLLEWELIEEKELTGVVPLLFNADGTPLLDYLISGNEEHSGTPTPDNPIMPQGTGERTGNLFDKDNVADRRDLSASTGNIVNGQTKCVSDYIEISENTSYTTHNVTTYVLYNNLKEYLSGLNIETGGIRDVTIDNTNGKYIRIACEIDDKSTVMLNSGSTALPYEPYGYKIPISSANTTTPIYLGEVQSTRKVKKLVLTGEENFDHYGSGVFWVKVEDNNAMINGYGVSNSYVFNPIILDIPTAIANNEFCLTSANGRLWIRNTNCNKASVFKSYLQQQYAAGTPVTVWYVLATEQTAVVNEPLMKIGDYADTLSMEQAGVEIPTVNGENTLDVLTEVKPSEVYIKYKGR